MAIVTDSTIDVGNYITFNIGLSKSISNYTADEVWNFPYCSSSWDAFRHVFDESYQGIAPGTVEASEYNMPFHFTGVNQMYTPATYNFEEGQIDYNQGDLGIYGKIIWLCEVGNTSIGNIFGTQRCITNTDGVKIVTQMDMTKVFLFLNNFEDPSNHDPMYVNYDNFKIKEDHDGITSYEHPRNYSIFPAVMFMYNGKLYIHRIFQDSYTNLDWSWWLSYFGDADHGGHTELQGHYFNSQPICYDDEDYKAYFAINIMRQFSGLRPTSTERFYTASDIQDVGVHYQWMYGYDGGRICPATEAKYLQMASWYGGMFYHNGTYYKPIIENGYVTGYTSDMDAPSDIDNWTGATNHNVPPLPPTPPAPEGDDIDPQQSGNGTKIGGVSNLWLLTTAQMTAFHNAINGADWDVMPSIISVMGLGIPPLRILDDIEVITNIVLKKSDGTTWSSGVSGHICTTQKNKFVYSGITVQRKYNDFRDFSPYATHEIFVPMCGWLSLPDIAVERGCQVEYVFDIENCKIRCIVSTDDCIIGEREGIMGCSVSLSNTGHALYVNSAIVNAANAVGSGVSLLTGGSVKGLEGAAMAGIGGLAQSVGNAVVNDRINRTESMVGNGSRTGFSDGEWILVKSTYTDSDESPLYAHTIGYPCNKSGKLNTFHGFTICANPHVHISATSTEKEEIKRLLEQGVILP